MQCSSEVDHGFQHWVAGGVAEPEPELFAESLHVVVLGQDVTGDLINILIATDLNQSVEQRSPDSLAADSDR